MCRFISGTTIQEHWTVLLNNKEILEYNLLCINFNYRSDREIFNKVGNRLKWMIIKKEFHMHMWNSSLFGYCILQYSTAGGSLSSGIDYCLYCCYLSPPASGLM